MSCIMLLCLEEGLDQMGKPLVSDCSIRGEMAGFAHLSCIGKYAKKTCKQAADGNLSAFADPWDNFSNCKQTYQNQLLLDLSSAFVSYVEECYPGDREWDKVRVMTDLLSQVVTGSG